MMIQTAMFQACVNCHIGAPGYPHMAECPRPKYLGEPDADSPVGRACARLEEGRDG